MQSGPLTTRMLINETGWCTQLLQKCPSLIPALYLHYLARDNQLMDVCHRFPLISTELKEAEATLCYMYGTHLRHHHGALICCPHVDKAGRVID